MNIHVQPTASIAQVDGLECTDSFDEITLDATGTGTGVLTYAWTGPNDFTSTNEDPVLVNVTEANSGTYTIIVTDENGCISDAASVEVDVTNSIAQPVIVSNAPVCEGETVTLSIEEYVGTNVTYAWTKDGALLA